MDPLHKNLNDRYSFHGQDSGETILFVIHRHWFDILIQFLPFLAALIGIGIASVVFGILFPELLAGIDTTLFFFIENTILVFLWLFGFLVWIDYYLDVWIITDRRIVNIEQNGLFVRHMSEVFLFRIQDATSEVGGFFPSILNFGDVYVQSAGERERFRFHKVPDPYGIKDTIMDMVQETHQDESVFFENALEAVRRGAPSSPHSSPSENHPGPPSSPKRSRLP
ncbi:MAG: PH domain-containing protein [Candidatus Moraniibacteriota bacterium]|nr:MAG: PH domain-containing protein [Candidatus Moranbacteria bacterium]